MFQIQSPKSTSAQSDPLITTSALVASSIHDLSDPKLAKRVYSNNAPKILLETLTARTGTLIIIFTYLAFILGFIIDLETILQSSHQTTLTSFDCSSNSLSGNTGCLNGSSWSGLITGLDNVVSIEMNVGLFDFNSTEFCEPYSTSSSLTFSVLIQACPNSNGCESTGKWDKVLSMTKQTPVNFEPSMTISIFPSTFQNQESIPTRSVVHSYLVSVNYLSDPCHLLTQNTHLEKIQYTFFSFQRSDANQQARNVFTGLLITATIIIFGSFVYIVESNVRKSRNAVWLNEQVWILVYFIVVVLYQNPVALYINCTPPEIQLDPSVPYSAYFIDNLSQACFFVIWLAFADSVHLYTKSVFEFYSPKISLGILILVISALVLKFLFPSLTVIDGDRSPYLAVANWTEQTKLAFCFFSILEECLLWIWLLSWFWDLYSASRTLNRMPYMTTRYLQLSHRYFIVQALIVTFYYMFEYGAILYNLTYSDPVSGTTLTELTDNINSLSRAQSQLFGKMIFLTAYAWLLAFLFLPADFMDGHDHEKERTWTSLLTSTYVITEEECAVEVWSRHSLLSQLQTNTLTNSVLLVKQFLNAKKFVFCIDLGLKLRMASFQSYYDPPQMKSKSGYEGQVDLQQIGLRLIASYYDEEFENVCLICRELSGKQRIVVTFRGTASRRQMELNLDYKLVEVDLFSPSLHLPPSPSPSEDLSSNSIDLDPSPFAFDPILNLPDWLEYFKEFETVDDLPIEPDERNNNHDSLSGFLSLSSLSKITISQLLTSLSPTKTEQSHPHQFQEKEEKEEQKGKEKSDLESNLNNYDPPPHPSSSSPSNPPPLQRTFTSTLVHGAENLERGVERLVKGVGGATQTLIGATGGAVVTAAQHTPGLKRILTPFVHRGFWMSYLKFRHFLHSELRKEILRVSPSSPSSSSSSSPDEDTSDLSFNSSSSTSTSNLLSPLYLLSSSSSSSSPSSSPYSSSLSSSQSPDVLFTGHSLGGALSTLASIDFSVHSLPYLNRILRKREREKEKEREKEREKFFKKFNGSSSSFSDSPSSSFSSPPSHDLSSSSSFLSPQSFKRSTSFSFPSFPSTLRFSSSSSPSTRPNEPLPPSTSPSSSFSNSPSPSPSPSSSSEIPFKEIRVCMYNFGSPRVGNLSFASLYDRMVPNSFRVVVDGDLVVGLPPSGFKHVGTAVIVDSLGAGSILLDPSFVERWLRTQAKRSVSAHSLMVYRKGLLGVKHASEMLASFSSPSSPSLSPSTSPHPSQRYVDVSPLPPLPPSSHSTSSSRGGVGVGVGGVQFSQSHPINNNDTSDSLHSLELLSIPPSTSSSPSSSSSSSSSLSDSIHPPQPPSHPPPSDPSLSLPPPIIPTLTRDPEDHSQQLLLEYEQRRQQQQHQRAFLSRFVSSLSSSNRGYPSSSSKTPGNNISISSPLQSPLSSSLPSPSPHSPLLPSTSSTSSYLPPPLSISPTSPPSPLSSSPSFSSPSSTSSLSPPSSSLPPLSTTTPVPSTSHSHTPPPSLLSSPFPLDPAESFALPRTFPASSYLPSRNRPTDT